MASLTEAIKGFLGRILHADAGDDGPSLPRNLMVLISLGQGVALLALWRAAAEETWPLQTPALNWSLWTFAIIWPVLLLLSLEAGNIARVLKLASGAVAVAVLLGIHIGWQATPFGAFPIFSLLAVYVLTLLVASFKTLMYLQQRAAGEPATYPALFARSWRNFLVTALSAALTAGVAIILTLWGELFRAIGIDFFIDLFSEDWFLFPVLAVAFGLGTFIFRRLTRVIDAIVSLLEGLMRLLLPLLGLVVAIFLATLPFTGLGPLWRTGTGTALLMALNGLALFGVNAVYQTGERSRYPLAVHRALYGSVALLPIISGLAIYGLALRVEQYGWTVARCWAFTLAVLLAAFSVGYAWSIVRSRDSWTGGFAKVNIWMGWVVLALMVLVNTPILDFRSISLASQFGRVEASEIELMDFDFAYVEENLARPGWLKRTALIEENNEADPVLAEYIRNPVPSWSDKRIWERMTLRPEPFEIPDGLRAAMSRSHPNDIDATLVQADLNEDGQPEYVLLFAVRDAPHIWGELYYRERCAEAAPTTGASAAIARPDADPPEQAPASSADQALPPPMSGCDAADTAKWRSTPVSTGQMPKGTDAVALLRNGDISTVPAAFADLKIGGVVLRSIL